MRRGLAFPAVVALVTAAGMAGCGRPHVDPVVNTVPTVAVSGTYGGPGPEMPSLPPATHRWKTTNLSCPTLSDWVVSQLSVPATGRATLDVGGSLDCQWGPDDGSATKVTLKLQTTANPGAGDDAFRLLAAIAPDPLPGVGEAAFVNSGDGGQQWIAVRTGNATLVVEIMLAFGKDNDKVMQRQVHRAAPSVAKDMLTALVPA